MCKLKTNCYKRGCWEGLFSYNVPVVVAISQFPRHPKIGFICDGHPKSFDFYKAKSTRCSELVNKHITVGKHQNPY